jgi:hypothetical protein
MDKGNTKVTGKKMGEKVPPSAGASRQKKDEAATVFMAAWAEWHNTQDQMPSDEVLNAAAGIFEAYGKTFDDAPDGVYRVLAAVPARKASRKRIYAESPDAKRSRK